MPGVLCGNARQHLQQPTTRGVLCSTSPWTAENAHNADVYFAVRKLPLEQAAALPSVAPQWLTARSGTQARPKGHHLYLAAAARIEYETTIFGHAGMLISTKYMSI